MAGMGDPCAGGAYTDANLIMPNGTAPAVSAQNPVRCFFKAPNSSTYQNLAGNCPQDLQPGPYGYSIDPRAINPPFWQIVQGDAIEIQVPVVSSQPLNGSSQLRGYLQLADGQNDPILQPALSMIVNPSGSQNVSGSNEQIGILYPSPSITSNAQQSNTSTTVGVKGYVQNNSNPGHVVAQAAYADSSGDCTSPGTIVYTTPQVALQNPQTLVTGSVTGLYADVAYCWRLVATVTSGAQAGTYYGNWEYFITNGTYHAYSGEPAPANPPAAGTQCSTNGSGCATSNCTSTSCSSGGSASGAGQQLTVAPAGTGSGSVSDGKFIACPGKCSASYLTGAKVTLTATPASGSQFAGWNGGGCSGTGTCTVTMSAAQAVTATFAAIQGGGGGGQTGGTINSQGVGALLKILAVVRNRSLRSLTHKGLSLQLACVLACQAAVRLYLDPATASRLHLAGAARARKPKHAKRPVLIGSATAALVAGTTKRVTITLTHAAARALSGLRSVRLTGNVVVTGAGGTSTTKSFSLSLHR